MAAPLQLQSLERLGDSFAGEHSVERKRMLVIVNPYATTVSDRLKNLVVYALQGRYDVQAVDTQRRDHATELCREAAQEGIDVVVAFGGDGTLNEAANGLAGSSVPLTTLPGGATNVYCKMLGIPGDIVDATEHLLRLADRWEPRRVDLAKANDRWFTFSSGVGLDASVVHRVDLHPRMKTRLGAYYFTYAGITTFLKDYVLGPPRLEAVLADGTTFPGVTSIVQNGDPFTYFKNHPIKLVEGQTLDSGSLSGIVLQRSTPTVMPGVMFRLFSERARITGHRAVSGFEEVPTVTIRSADERPLPLQVDGDYIGHVDEVAYSLAPGGLTVVA
ncbi:diacylglycerol kinase family protein [Paraconexibacter sp.]|uniref:diacylglycerol/lipid kinase family protein n=1 Tax=Paraconexibacter sp. TaxID=2949640 RepID=UPI0035653D50